MISNNAIKIIKFIKQITLSLKFNIKFLIARLLDSRTYTTKILDNTKIVNENVRANLLSLVLFKMHQFFLVFHA